MRILIASGIFHPDSGGPATYLYRLLPVLQAHGHEVRALAYGNAPTVGYPYPLTRIPFRRGRMVRYMLAYRQLAGWADLIYLNSLGLPRPELLVGDSHKPHVMKVVGDYAWERSLNKGWLPATEDVDAFQTQRYNPLINWLKASRGREVQAMDRVIVPSEYLRRMMIGWGAQPDRVQVIYNALDTPPRPKPLPRKEGGALIPSFTPSPRKDGEGAGVRGHLGWSPDDHYILTVARLVPWKGIDMLIDALVSLPAIKLVIAGDGPQESALRQRTIDQGVADRVTFLGKVPHEQVTVYMQAADYLALYSGYEGLSHTLLEALSVGTPVIASARGGNPEMVKDGVNGLLVKHPDPAALREALKCAFQGDTQRRLAAGTSVGMDRFDWETLVQQTILTLESVYRSCTS